MRLYRMECYKLVSQKIFAIGAVCTILLTMFWFWVSNVDMETAMVDGAGDRAGLYAWMEGIARCAADGNGISQYIDHCVRVNCVCAGETDENAAASVYGAGRQGKGCVGENCGSFLIDYSGL